MRIAGGRRAAGICLVDVCAAVMTVGVLTVAVAVAIPRWTGGAHQSAVVTSVQLLLREAQQDAIGKGRPQCVDAQTWTVRPGACGPDREGVTFFADGSATPGAFAVGSDTLTVDAFGATAVT